MRLSLSAVAIWVLPVIIAASTSCSGPDSSCAANEMEETNVLLQMTEVNEDKDVKIHDAIPPKEEKEKGKKGYFGGWWKPKWYRHNPIFNRRRHPTTSPLNLLFSPTTKLAMGSLA